MEDHDDSLDLRLPMLSGDTFPLTSVVGHRIKWWCWIRLVVGFNVPFVVIDGAYISPQCDNVSPWQIYGIVYYWT